MRFQWLKVNNKKDSLEKEMIFLSNALINSLLLGSTLMLSFIVWYYSSEEFKNQFSAWTPVFDAVSYLLFLIGVMSYMFSTIAKRLGSFILGFHPLDEEHWLRNSSNKGTTSEKKMLYFFSKSFIASVFSILSISILLLLPSSVGLEINNHSINFLIFWICLSFGLLASLLSAFHQSK